MLFPVFILKREARSVRPSKWVFTWYIWLCSSNAWARTGCACRHGVARRSQAGGRDETTGCSPGGPKESCSTIHSELVQRERGCHRRASGENFARRGWPYGQGAEVGGRPVLCSDSSFSRLFLCPLRWCPGLPTTALRRLPHCPGTVPDPPGPHPAYQDSTALIFLSPSFCVFFLIFHVYHKMYIWKAACAIFIKMKNN